MRRAERGIAAITAILIVAVAASAASLMLAQQSAMLDQTMLVASRAQADQYARAGVDWARGVLAESSRQKFDSLADGWAQPIAALPVERALVAGAITDENGKFNLNNLVNVSQRNAEDYKVFARLLGALGLAPELADAVVDWIDADGDLVGPGGAEDAYYLALRKPYRPANKPMVQVEELYRVRGFDAAAVAKLKPYVAALPGAHTAVNVNTASEVVLAAVLPEVPRARIADFVSERRAKPVEERLKIKTRLAQASAAALDLLDVQSAYFSVRIQVSQDEVELASDALVRRVQGAPPAIIWRRPRY